MAPHSRKEKSSMKRIKAAEMDYGPEEIEQLRTELIAIRDEALKHPVVKEAVVLSHAIALLAAVKREVWPNT